MWRRRIIAADGSTVESRDAVRPKQPAILGIFMALPGVR